ncbi:kinase-like domain-containing protein [Stachybotrys elegans]|uniref:Kinase-like domain-containing protein n=1 Tax=Stachybotrys elegans TaxID=80388 RepID=A0A8K0WLZ1_9HYPO|nr:kinase-like domain-containing protein [Stachybotrys elegans]
MDSAANPPPLPPNAFRFQDLELEEPPFYASGHSFLYKLRNHPSLIFKARAHPLEYRLQLAAEACAVLPRQEVFTLTKENDWYFMGFTMDLARPLDPLIVRPEQRQAIADSMINAVETLHEKGIVHGDIKLENMLLDEKGSVLLCDFAEARVMGEDEDEWEGQTTWHYISPARRRKIESLGSIPPPVPEDDMYGLGLSIWALYTKRVPLEDIALDDIALGEVLLKGETVDVSAVTDEPARERIKELLRKGGARVHESASLLNRLLVPFATYLAQRQLRPSQQAPLETFVKVLNFNILDGSALAFVAGSFAATRIQSQR